MNLNFTQPKKEVFHFLNFTNVDAVMGINEKFIVLFTEGKYNVKIPETTPSDPILAKLCEKSGAKMYGDYLVYNPYNLTMFIAIDHKIYNIFQEYSKFLRNEENNWNKCKIILKSLDN
jgi:hypothetical protein